MAATGVTRTRWIGASTPSTRRPASCGWGSTVVEDGDLVVEDERSGEVDRVLIADAVRRVQEPPVVRQACSRRGAGVLRFGRRGCRADAERRRRDDRGSQKTGERATVQPVTAVAGHAVGYGIHGVPPIGEALDEGAAGASRSGSCGITPAGHRNPRAQTANP